MVNGDGDGTVNARSLESCKNWMGMKAQYKKDVHTFELAGADHLGILSDSRGMDYIAKLLSGIAFDREWDQPTTENPPRERN